MRNEIAETPLRILLVDDDEDERIIVGDLLWAGRTREFELTWVSNYDEGLQAILTGAFDVCLVDYRLGARTGLDLLSEVAAHANDAQVILLTGEGDREVDVTATRAGAADYLVKGELNSAILERALRYAAERGRTLQALRKATLAAEASNRAKGDFLATMSHEMRTPMNAILGMADMLWETPLDITQQHYVQVFRRAGANLLTLINDLLDLSKIEAGQLDLEQVEFDLKQVLDEAIELMEPKARIKGLRLEMRLSPRVHTQIMGDPLRLKQVLINLLGNAVKFTNAGEIAVSVQPAPSGKQGAVEFAVTDSGIGIPPEKLGTIFEDFAQADSSVTRKYGGTGLGLGICRRLVEKMGGVIEVSSVPGEGSTFHFQALFESAPPRKAANRELPPSRELMDLQGCLALLVESDDANRLSLLAALTKWGIGYEEFASPPAALGALAEAHLAGRQFSIAIVDNRTAGIDGFQSVSCFREVDPDLPLILLTSGHPQTVDPHGGDVAFAATAVKPVRQDDLFRLIHATARRPPGATNRANGVTHPPINALAMNILAAEDSPDNQALVRAYLGHSPHTLTFVEDGKQAIEQFKRGVFDLILMDVQMPVMDGLTATRAIRDIERETNTAPIPIVALTANALTRDLELSRLAGCTAHLAKPFSKARLLSAIGQYAAMEVAG